MKVCFIPSHNLPNKKLFVLWKKVEKNVEIFMVCLHSKTHLKINLSLNIFLAQQWESGELTFEILHTVTTLMLTFSAIYHNKICLSFLTTALTLATCLSSITLRNRPGFGLFCSNKSSLQNLWCHVLIVYRSSTSSMSPFVSYF